MQIRQLGPADAKAYREIRLEALKSVPEAFGSDYDESAKRPLDSVRAWIESNVILVAEVDAQMIGSMVLHRDEALKSKHRGMIFGVYVREGWRRRGAARALMQAAIEAADGLEQLELFVSSGCPGARALYEAMGFVCTGRVPNALRVGDKTYAEDLMILDLRG